MTLYPLKFKTIFKEKIWGGDKIQTILGKDFSPLVNCGEAWELSGVYGDISVVKDGSLKNQNLATIINMFGKDLVGQKVYEKHGNEFPLLIKFIDANDDLSIQVHPDDNIAMEKHNSKGKTEMWYIIQADDKSNLISGFNESITREDYITKFKNGEIMQVLNKVPVFSDDAFFVPAGRVHTIGKGLLLAEIQQTSDVTYRIYDYDRVDDQGNERELHNNLALEAINFDSNNQVKLNFGDQVNYPNNLVTCPYFTTNKIELEGKVERDFSKLDSFVIYICLKERVQIKVGNFDAEIVKGEVILIPSIFERILLSSEGGQLLEVYIE